MSTTFVVSSPSRAVLPLPSIVSSPTPLLSADVATLTAIATSSCSSPTAVVVQLATDLLIPNFPQFYDEQVETFQPTWTNLADGSLVTPAYLDELSKSFLQLMMAGALLLLFTRNTIASTEYILFSGLKTKTLLYVLFISQVLGVISSAVSIATYFHHSMDCIA